MSNKLLDKSSVKCLMIDYSNKIVSSKRQLPARITIAHMRNCNTGWQLPLA
jgi:hypothetical protein